MTTSSQIEKMIRRRFPDSTVVVSVGDDGRYDVAVRRPSWGRLEPWERQAVTYNTLERLPVEVAARIGRISAS